MNNVVNRLKNYLKPMNIAVFLIAFLGAYILFPIYFEATIYPLPSSDELWKSLDPSWLLQMNYAVNNNFVWGKDIAYTYGPLAYLSTKVGWGQSAMSFLLYDFFISLNFFLLLFLTLKASKNKIVTILLFTAFIIAFPVWVGSDNAVVLMGLLIFWIRKSLDEPKWYYYIFQTLILSLIFFIKFNTGLIAFPLFISGITYNLIVGWKNKKTMLKLITALVAPVALISILAIPLKVNLSPYIYYGIEMVSGYNDIMYMDHDYENRKLALIIIALSSIVLVYKTVIEIKSLLLKNLTILFLFGTGMFVLYKQGFVRGMEVDFFIFSILIIISIYDLHSHNYKKYSDMLILGCAAISLYFVMYIENAQPNIAQKLNKLYFIQYGNFTKESGMHLFPNNNQLPDYVKNKIGNHTIDAYPWNLQMLWENKLNCSTRPAFQSHSTYTKDLEELNFEHYNSSEKAPEFVIYDFASIDSRYALFDEPKLNLILTKNYHVVEVFDFEKRKVLLLQKNINFRPIKLEKSKEYAMLINSPLVVKKDIYYEVELYNNFKGKWNSIIDHAPEILLEVYGNNPEPYKFRTSKNLLQSGLFCDSYIPDTSGFGNYLINKTDLLEKAKYYNFRPLNNKYFSEKIKITEYKIIQ